MPTPDPRTESPNALAFITRFFAAESAGGLVLMAAALAALIVANSPLADSYFAALHAVFAGLSVSHWINDGLMAIFFMLVGLEIKREMLAGQLASWSQRALPGFAALGGMVFPALSAAGPFRLRPTSPSRWVCCHCSASACRCR